MAAHEETTRPRMRLGERTALADKVRGSKGEIAERVTDEFLVRHPDWIERYGERARHLGVKDACFHVDFLCAAIEGGAHAAFEDYVRWTRRVLSSRGIASHFLSENLQQVGVAIDGSLTTTEREVVRDLIAAGRAACSDEAGEREEPGGGPLAATERIFRQAILAGQRHAATGIALEALDSGCEIVDLYVDVFQRALYNVGRFWEEGRIAVAQEHMATAVTQFVIAQVASRLDIAPFARGRAVIAGVEGEFHQIGAHMVADVLEARGWDVRFLGTNVPHAGIIDIIKSHKADLVGISATMPFNLAKALDLVRAIRNALHDSRPRILLGGAAFRSVPTLYEEADADGYAVDLREAMAFEP